MCKLKWCETCRQAKEKVMMCQECKKIICFYCSYEGMCEQCTRMQRIEEYAY